MDFFPYNILSVKKGKEYSWAKLNRKYRNSTTYQCLEHRIIAENYLGRYLEKGEQIHHINGDKHDNRIENFELINIHEHVSKHNYEHGRKYAKVKCPYCKNEFIRPYSQLQKGYDLYFCSKPCSYEFNKYYKDKEKYKDLLEEHKIENIIEVFIENTLNIQTSVGR